MPGKGWEEKERVEKERETDRQTDRQRESDIHTETRMSQ